MPISSQPKTGTAPEAKAGPDSPMPIVAPQHSFGSSLYGLFLLALIVAYYAVLVFVAGELLQWSVRLIREAGSAGNWLWMLAYLAVAAVCATLLIRTAVHVIYSAMGLVTPLYDTVPEATEGIEIKRDDYPKLFALLDRVGQAVGSPAPNEVRVHHAPEPGAFELRRFGITAHRRLVLVLSLPQMGVLTEDEFAVIVAHELSHFGCGYTRLVVFLDRFLNSLRRSIDSISSYRWRFVDPIYWFQVGYRKALVLLSAPMQRHQELRADSVSAALYGGELASRTLLKNWLLANQFLTAIGSYDPDANDLSEAGSDNVFAWFRKRWRDFSVDGEEYLLKRLEAMQHASFWNDDPTISERVQAMRSFPTQAGNSARPVRELLGDFSELENRLHNMLLEEA